MWFASVSWSPAERRANGFAGVTLHCDHCGRTFAQEETIVYLESEVWIEEDRRPGSVEPEHEGWFFCNQEHARAEDFVSDL